MSTETQAEVIFINGCFTTLDPDQPRAEAAAVKGGLFLFVGSAAEAKEFAGPETSVINLQGRSALPGLHDSHLHLIRGGLNYNMELRWDGVRSLADAMNMLKRQIERTPPPQWVRVVGGFSERQFHEKRLPTLEEINALAPETPVFILHLYDRALLNAAALRVLGYGRDTPNPPGGEIQRDRRGSPTGLLLARPNAGILYSALARGPALSREDQLVSSKLFMRELNRLGITSAVDAGGGFQNYPEDYAIIEKLAADGDLTVRIAYNLFTQKPKSELADFQRWSEMLQSLAGDAMFRHNGAGEMLVFSAADFEDFRCERPEMPAEMEPELEQVVRLLVEKRWPFRMHATYDETISRALDVFERVDKDVPFGGLHWFFDHGETISVKNIDRVKALGGGIAIQRRMAYQGEYFVERYGVDAASRTPPIQEMLKAGIPVGGGTDATRVASYNPWVCLHWLVTGKTVGGIVLYDQANILDRETALRLWTVGSSWFSNEEGAKGMIKAGQYADFIVPSSDYFTVPEDDIQAMVSHLTVVGGKVVHGDGDFTTLAPPLPKVSPDWSPVKEFGGCQPNDIAESALARIRRNACSCGHCRLHGGSHAASWLKQIPAVEQNSLWSSLGCTCWL